MLKVLTHRKVPPGEFLMLVVSTYVLPWYLARPAIRYLHTQKTYSSSIK